MNIKSSSSIAEIAIDLIEISKPDRSHPSVAFSIAAKNEDYSGTVRQVWFDKEDLEAFIQECEELFNNEHAFIKLQAYSDFWLSVRRINATGQLAFRVHLEHKISESLLELEVTSDLSVVDAVKTYFRDIILQMS